MQVPSSDKKELKKFLASLGYPHWDESNNPAYKLFLA
jgi:threonine dehydratase